MLSTDSSGRFVVETVYIHRRIVGKVQVFSIHHTGLFSNNPPGVLFGKRSDPLWIFKDTLLSGNNLLNTIGQLFPLLLGKVEISAKVQDGSLPRPPFCSNGIDQFVGKISPAILLVCVFNGANKHANRITRKITRCQPLSLRFWHYTCRYNVKLLEFIRWQTQK